MVTTASLDATDCPASRETRDFPATPDPRDSLDLLVPPVVETSAMDLPALPVSLALLDLLAWSETTVILDLLDPKDLPDPLEATDFLAYPAERDRWDLRETLASLALLVSLASKDLPVFLASTALKVSPALLVFLVAATRVFPERTANLA